MHLRIDDLPSFLYTTSKKKEVLTVKNSYPQMNRTNVKKSYLHSTSLLVFQNCPTVVLFFSIPTLQCKDLLPTRYKKKPLKNIIISQKARQNKKTPQNLVQKLNHHVSEDSLLKLFCSRHILCIVGFVILKKYACWVCLDRQYPSFLLICITQYCLKINYLLSKNFTPAHRF